MKIESKKSQKEREREQNNKENIRERRDREDIILGRKIRETINDQKEAEATSPEGAETPLAWLPRMQHREWSMTFVISLKWTLNPLPSLNSYRPFLRAATM